jgi:hypothetical protein
MRFEPSREDAIRGSNPGQSHAREDAVRASGRGSVFLSEVLAHPVVDDVLLELFG